MKHLDYLLLATAFFTLSSCDNIDHQKDVPSANGVNQNIVATFNDMYPNAQNVEWDVKNNYSVASFYMSTATKSNSRNHSAWFDNRNYEWAMTETDLGLASVPQGIISALEASEYADWKIDDIDLIVRQGMEMVYVIEVEHGEKSVDLYYTDEGILVKSVIDADDNYDYSDFIPQATGNNIQDWIANKYPDARIIEIDVENNGTEVEIIDGNVVRDVLFDNSGQWVYSKTEVRWNNLPSLITQKFSSSEYSKYHIDDIDFYQTPDKEYYRFDLEYFDGDVKIDISTDGTITVVGANGNNNNNNSGMVDSDMVSFIQTKYPGAKIIEKDTDDGFLEIEILHENREKKLYFNGAGSWVYSKWDLSYRELPESVKNTLKANYPSINMFNIDDVEKVEEQNSSYYMIELEIRDRDIIVRIDDAGNVLN